MDLLQALPELTLEQMLFIAERDHVPVNSQISRCIVGADLVRAIEQRMGLRSNLLFGPDPLGYQIAIEAGVDPGAFQVRRKTHAITGVRRFCDQHGVFERALSDDALLSAVGAVIYERKVPVPTRFWFNRIQEIFAMSRQNFISNYDTFDDDTPEEYIWFADFGSQAAFLLYQTNETLLQLARSIIPPTRPYFETRAGILDYLVDNLTPRNRPRRTPMGNSAPQVIQPHEELYDRFLHVCRVVNEYPGRLQMFSRLESLSQYPISNPIEKPPLPYERAYLTAALEGRLNEVFPVLNDLSEIDAGTTSVNQALLSDPNLRVGSRQELFDLQNQKIFRRIPPKEIYRLTGWKNIHAYHDARNEMVRETEFNLVSDSFVCPNQTTIFLEPREGLTITYGPFLNIRCYSPEELEASFIVTDQFVAFRKPDRPDEVFTENEVNDLLDMIEEQDPEFHARTRDLVVKIRRGLSQTTEITPEIVQEQFERLIPEDRVSASKIFEDFFLAGMTQRTWSGTGPFPMKSDQTEGSSLQEIEIKMTPILNDIQDQYNKLSPEGKAVLNSLPVVDFENGVFIRRTDPLLDFGKQTREGNFCIGYGSRLMIYSGVFYLSALGVVIPGFSLDEFEPESTHR
jgi:hypothetical protein